MSTYNAPVVKIQLNKHENADSLSIIPIDNFQVVGRTADWENLEYGIYIPPDSIVDTTKSEFSFLADGKNPLVRVKAKRLRGVWSMGLLIPAPPNAKLGDDYYASLGIQHYEPEEVNTGSNAISGPKECNYLVKYDVENGRKLDNSRHFIPNELVHVSEKIHGQNMAAVYIGDTYYVRTRSQWIEETKDSLYWRALRANIPVMNFLKDNPETVIYGEQYGHIKNYPYDCNKGEVKFAPFDIMNPISRSFYDYEDFKETCIKYNIITAPSLGLIPFNMDELIKLAETKSLLKSKIMEGIVIRPMKERRSENGRVLIKIVNPEYLTSN